MVNLNPRNPLKIVSDEQYTAKSATHVSPMLKKTCVKRMFFVRLTHVFYNMRITGVQKHILNMRYKTHEIFHMCKTCVNTNSCKIHVLHAFYMNFKIIFFL